ncbi:MAG: response regulator [Ignavibacteriales bacterium]|nr:response regulator [Ignavibacteriales bacterium]MCF8316847.1 response regulator [Ignavibacteriales bacterium]MCF8438114.1 response regulator [Ignavibacteriales bacterium]
MMNKILIVDDETHHLNIYAKVFRESGYVTLGVADLKTAFGALDEFQPDLVLLDIVLGNESGFDLLKLIKSNEKYKSVYVVIITGIKSSADDQAAGLEMGADGFLVRPLAIRELVIRIDAFFRQKRTAEKLRKSEASFRKLIEKNPDAMLIVNSDGKIIFANPAAADLFKAEIDELQNKLFGYPIVHGERTEINLVRHDSEEAIGEMRTINIDWEDKAAVLISIRDITDRKRTEAALKVLNEDLESMIEKRTEQLRLSISEMEAFTYTISHDLRTPLRAIIGFSRLVAEEHGDKLNDEGKILISDILRNTKKMTQLIEDLLEFSRLGTKGVYKKNVDIKNLFRQVFFDLTDETSRSSIDFRIGELSHAYGDSSLLKQVVSNILSNALKFSAGRKSPVIEVECEDTEDMTIYSVSDNGVGFDMKYSGKIYGVFSRLHKESEFEGTGVGLAIAQRIILKHGGSVWAESEEDKGAKFFFSLPKSNGTEMK